MAEDAQLPDKIQAYYNEGREIGRLDQTIGPLELARTQALITRFFPPPPAAVLDIGGFFSNLAPVTLGNMIGGGILVGAVYWFIYLRDR